MPVTQLASPPLPGANAASANLAEAPVLQLSGITKRFNGVHALNGVRLSIRPGEVMALIGENGAGKSTLVKTLTGIHRPDAGSILLDGKEVAFGSPQEAMAAGITAVHQETVMFDELTVAENIYVGRHPTRGPTRRIDWKNIEDEAERLFARLEVALPVRARVRDLSVAQRHFVEIARALSQDARVVIMDEPTAALSQREIRELYRIIDQLKAAGTAVIFISHKFDEIFEVADCYTVLRDGQFVAEGRLADIGEPELVALMVGRAVHHAYPKAQVEIGAPLLEVRDLCHPTEFQNVSFTLRRGEILGFYGLVGAGRSEVMQALFGLTSNVRGSVHLEGRDASFGAPRDAIAAGLAYVPEDRQQHGAHLSQPIAHNITLPILSRFGFFTRARAEAQVARRFAEQLELKAHHLQQNVAELSGGNQQKVVLGKWLATDPKVIILDEPTKGIDIGSKAAVHRFISELVERGLSVILVSSELPEVLGLADRVVVMRQGRVVREFARQDATPETVVAAASGVELNAANEVAA
ncbi:sugar ABC transporter ATP-binding protein [Massilia sp. LC238]|uniref:sugar ABC transporter ATP-binding protein n=1 Tax=Massilia sp. LC238 TaxID=1502852 RepID=UPI0004E3371A|nr:sugar ABC transporter ATP-binding protein [Massilia sp. LC238]KFC71454.1 ABC-type sugar transport system, ATPase component protein [Massilia sp. LC238]